VYKRQPTNTAPASTFIDQVVGEGKKYSSVEELAKGQMNGDQYINQLKEELEGIRGELDKRLTAEEMVQEIKREREELKANQNATENTTPQYNEEAVTDLISKTFDAREGKKVAEANINVVDAKMKELYGNDKAAQVVKDKAQAMGVSLDWLQDAAAKSPSAFFSVMGISLEGGKTTTPSATVSSTTNTQAVEQVHASGIQQDTWKHFEEIRKSDPRTYWKAETQQRLFKARNEKGESFYT
jgi:hypothetical protein